MSDYLVRGMTMDGFVKAVAIRSTELVRRAAEIHDTTPTATAALGRCLTAASMMGNMQKVENGSMTACKEKGLVRSEGKEYVMKDGDITLFRFNV